MDVELIKQENKRLRGKMYYFSGYTHTQRERRKRDCCCVFKCKKRGSETEVFEMREIEMRF